MQPQVMQMHQVMHLLPPKNRKVTELFKPKKGRKMGDATAGDTNAQLCAFAPPEEPQGQTQAEAAKVLGVHRNTIQNWDKADAKERAAVNETGRCSARPLLHGPMRKILKSDRKNGCVYPPTY